MDQVSTLGAAANQAVTMGAFAEFIHALVAIPENTKVSLRRVRGAATRQKSRLRTDRRLSRGETHQSPSGMVSMGGLKQWVW